MRVLLLISMASALFIQCNAAQPSYPSDLSMWKSVPIPQITDTAERMMWTHSANYSTNEWHVTWKHNRAHPYLSPESLDKITPPFSPKAEHFRTYEAIRVHDGWLIGFNKGEFGAALYWFGQDGKKNYEISKHQVISFVKLTNAIAAIEGLSHMGSSRGSVIRIDVADGKWNATELFKLPSAPQTVTVAKDQSMFISLEDQIIELRPNAQINVLARDIPWGSMYPNSSVLTPNERFLYFGMRQYVAEFEIPTKKIRFLIPSNAFLSKLSPEDEAYFRKHYSGRQKN